MGNKITKKLSSKQYELLEVLEVSPKDMILGFLCSACSVHSMHSITYRSAQDRARKKQQAYQEQYRMQQRIRQLEKEGYVTLSTQNNQTSVGLTPTGKQAISWHKIENLTRKKQNSDAWDGMWTIVFFDVPQQEKHIRYSLGAMLRRCGFYQTQMSVYVYPFLCPELVQALREHPSWSRYCQIVRASFYGDDTGLKKIFKL